ncbi:MULTISPECIES: hypothetical protein [Frankia]|uniref:Uncharacterized protein n=1 Tax=Frankia alni (strain DSM 45986 / CECT 9034 / ACN14a) TaxID=326424 RepID=Q0RM46_FRAAA|nr:MULTISPECIES: hypothetical protein [Frankia]CAJ61406.1 hypothetical protein; putative coiled-coil domain [Frankia alni ACN14a]
MTVEYRAIPTRFGDAMFRVTADGEVEVTASPTLTPALTVTLNGIHLQYRLYFDPEHAWQATYDSRVQRWQGRRRIPPTTVNAVVNQVRTDTRSFFADHPGLLDYLAAVARWSTHLEDLRAHVERSTTELDRAQRRVEEARAELDTATAELLSAEPSRPSEPIGVRCPPVLVRI